MFSCSNSSMRCGFSVIVGSSYLKKNLFFYFFPKQRQQITKREHMYSEYNERTAQSSCLLLIFCVIDYFNYICAVVFFLLFSPSVYASKVNITIY